MFNENVSAQETQLDTQVSKAAKNAAARKAYKKKLLQMWDENGLNVKYMFIDLTNDGVGEMIVSWWPAIYTYKDYRKTVG